MHFILHFWEISLGRIVVNTILFDIHKNYIVMNNSRVYAVISIFQRSLARQSRCFRLKVRGERLKAGSSYRFALNFVLCCRPRAGCAIVVIVIIVALAGLVVLGAARGFLGGPPPRAKLLQGRGRFLRRYSACMPRVRPTADSRRTTAEHSTCGGGAGASCGDTRQICRDRTNHEELAAEPRGYTANGG